MSTCATWPLERKGTEVTCTRVRGTRRCFLNMLLIMRLHTEAAASRCSSARKAQHWESGYRHESTLANTASDLFSSAGIGRV